jgi:hypothetical protein
LITVSEDEMVKFMNEMRRFRVWQEDLK